MAAARFALPLILMLVLGGAPAAGQTGAGAAAPAGAGGPASAGERPIALTISGAMSGGAYQAGVNWAVLEVVRRARADTAAFGADYRMPRFALRAITGASAGNINTLLWLVEWCTNTQGGDRAYRVTPPDSSLFSQVWSRIDVSEMLRPPEPSAPPEYALLNLGRVREITDEPLLRRLSDPRLDAACAVPAGVTFTRIRPGTLLLQEKLAIETQRFATVFAAKVGPPDPLTGQRLRFRPLFDTDAPYLDPRFGKLVQLSPYPGEITPARILNAVQASSAFPLAFRPVRLPVRYPDTGADSSDLFVDGGVFDNNPLSLALNLYRVSLGASGDTTRLDVLYVDPANLRPPLSRTVRRAEKTVPQGGLGAFVSMLDGAVSTARQYELQLIAREQDADAIRRALLGSSAERSEVVARSARLADSVRQVRGRLRRGDPGLARLAAALDSLRSQLDSLSARESARSRLFGTAPVAAPDRGTPASGEARLSSVLPPFTLHLSTRSFPLFSDRLYAAAAFLGRPLRDFDFWVGAYDGLHLMVRGHTCAGAGAGENDCVAAAMMRLIQDTVFFAEPGRSLMAALYDNEFRDDRPVLAAWIDSSEFSRRQVASDVLAARQRHVLLALFRAIDHENDPDPAATCSARTLLGDVLCGSGLMPLMRHLRTDSTRAMIAGESVTPWQVLEAWSRECSGAGAAAADCRAHPGFVALVDDPETAVAAITDQLIARLDRVERLLDAQRQGGPAWAPITSSAHWIYDFADLAHPPRSQFFTGGPPPEVRAWYRYLPYHIGGTVGAGGVEVRYRPTLYLSDRAALTFPLLGFASTARKETGGMEMFAGAGIGYARRTRLPLVLVLSEYGLEAHGYTGVDPHDGRKAIGCDVEPYLIGLAGTLRLGIRLPVAYARARMPGGLTIGLQNVASLIYWLRDRSD